jgi:hypothetical protein
MYDKSIIIVIMEGLWQDEKRSPFGYFSLAFETLCAPDIASLSLN